MTFPINPRGQPRRYQQIAEKVTGYPIDGIWSVVVPYQTDLTNIIINPSIETNTTLYAANGAGTIERSLERQQRGAYALKATPSSALSAGMYYGPITLANNTLYPWSFDFWGRGGLPYRAMITDGSFNEISRSVYFTGKTVWNRQLLKYRETAGGGARYLFVIKNAHANTTPFFVDGMLIPHAANDMAELRYFDGDSKGFVANKIDFFWVGTPHGSQSIMRAYTRAGGKIIPLHQYGFILTAMMGLGMASPNNIAIPLAIPGGEQYQRTLTPAREFDLVGLIEAATPAELRRQHSRLGAALDVRRQPVTTPLMLVYQPVNDCGDAIGNRVEITCSLSNGLEGQFDNDVRDDLALRFRVHVPFLGYREGQDSAVLDVRDSLADADFIVRRDRNGIWSDLQTGLSHEVRTTLWLPDGRLLLGGEFVDAGGAGNADYLAVYDPVADTFSALNATPLNAAVYSLLLLPDGTVAVGGFFTDAAGANADYLVRLNLSTGAFSAFNATPLSGGVGTSVRTMALLPSGDIAIGGVFLNAGGANGDYLTRMNGTTFAFSQFTSSNPLNFVVTTIEVGSNNYLFIGGLFTNAGGIPEADYFTWLVGPAYDTFFYDDKRLPTLNNQVHIIRRLSNGNLFIGGDFTDVNGDADWDYALIFTGGGMQKAVSALNGSVYSVAEIGPGAALLGGAFTQVAGQTLYDRLLLLSGMTVTPLDLNLPGTPIIYTIATTPAGDIAIGYSGTAGIGYTSGTSVVNNQGTVAVAPVIVITLPTTASVTSPLRSIRNLTTGHAISFDLTILIGETITIDLPRKTITSNIRGDLSHTVIPGSHFDAFRLNPGDNRINIFSTVVSGDVPVAYAYWQPAYADLADATR